MTRVHRILSPRDCLVYLPGISVPRTTHTQQHCYLTWPDLCLLWPMHFFLSDNDDLPRCRPSGNRPVLFAWLGSHLHPGLHRFLLFFFFASDDPDWCDVLKLNYLLLLGMWRHEVCRLAFIALHLLYVLGLIVHYVHIHICSAPC